MTDHPQTATERFLRHGVAGGFNGHTSYRDKMTSDDWEAQVGVIARELMKDIPALLLDPTLWEAAGRSLGWWLDIDELVCDCADCGFKCGNNSYVFCPKDGTKLRVVEKAIKKGCRSHWRANWHGLLDHLAAHPGDVDGYLAGLLTKLTKEE